jgi:hypothetical protein
MNKIKLVFLGGTDFSPNYFSNILKHYFDIEGFNTLVSYNKNTDIMLFSGKVDLHVDIFELLDQGFKFIIVNPYEARPYVSIEKFKPYLENILLILGCKNPYDVGWKHTLAVPNWFWYRDHLFYNDLTLGYYKNFYVPNRINSKLFLMPMRKMKTHRTKIREKLMQFLDNAIWSYVEVWENPKNLPTTKNLRLWPDMVFEPSWYDETVFSICVETAVNRNKDPDSERLLLRPEALACDLFVTEKSFKPMAFQHPFMVFAMQGTLEFLRSIGFETYDNLFDESYDTLEKDDDRLEIIYNNIKNFSIDNYADPLTQQKIIHNHELFYNKEKVLEGIKKDIILPILEWINAR